MADPSWSMPASAAPRVVSQFASFVCRSRMVSDDVVCICIPTCLTRYVSPPPLFFVLWPQVSMKGALAVLLLAAAAFAAEEECSGHGQKDGNGKCLCKGRWEGENCEVGMFLPLR